MPPPQTLADDDDEELAARCMLPAWLPREKAPVNAPRPASFATVGDVREPSGVTFGVKYFTSYQDARGGQDCV